MKLELLVTADQHAAVNMFPDPAHLARHTLGRDPRRSRLVIGEAEVPHRGEGVAR
jgi:hypothetical protein